MSNPNEFDTTKFAAELVQKNISAIVNSVMKVGKGTYSVLERKLRVSITEYVLNAADHYGTARTFFIRDVRTPLYNYYVPLDIGTGKTRIEGASIKRIFAIGNRVVIAGRAGCGKSTLMRHFFLDSVRDGTRIPVFVELNQVNSHEKVDLWTVVHQSMTKHGFKLDIQQLKLSVEDGGFTFLFDGLDEVHETHRKATLSQVEDIAALSSKNLVVVSSRPDDSTSQLKSFNVFQVLPLSVDKAVELINLIPFDEEIKRKFSSDLRSSLYEKHKTFLANPLLLSIMLLTFGQSASIPNKISIFFNQAYEVLFQTHDAYKGGFARKRSTSLDIQEFERTFAAFCLLSYDVASVSFSRSECLELMTKAKPLADADYAPQMFLKDCLQSVCLLMEDGLKITFVHRSFQEYFAAKCITRLDTATKQNLLDRFGKRSRSDNVIDRFWELDQRACESLWLIPMIEQLRHHIGVKKSLNLGSYLKYLQILCNEVSFEQHEANPKPVLTIHYDSNSTKTEPIRNAIFLTYYRYWNKTSKDRKIEAGLTDALPELSSNPVRTASLRSRSEDLKALRSYGWVLGWEFTKFLLELPTQITRQRETDLGSIEAILNIPRDKNA